MGEIRSNVFIGKRRLPKELRRPEIPIVALTCQYLLESFVTKDQDKAAALTFIKKAMKCHGRTAAIVTGGLRS